jgi:hypothetical protein
MSSPARLMGRVEAWRTHCVPGHALGQAPDSMVRGFPKGVKPRRRSTQRRKQHSSVARQPDEMQSSDRRRVRMATAHARGQGTAGRMRRRSESLCAPRLGSRCHSGRPALRRHPHHPGHRPATSRQGTTRRSPEPSASCCRSTGSEHLWSAYLSKTADVTRSCRISSRG